MPRPVTVPQLDADRTTVVAPRGLRPDERAMLEFLLDETFLGRDQLRRQLDVAGVVPECADGCPSLAFDVDPASEPTPLKAATVPVEAEGRDDDGMPILVALHAPDGYLRELEIVRFDGEPPRLFPGQSRCADG